MQQQEKVSIKLTDEQKRLIKNSTGHTVHELWVNIEGGSAVGRPPMDEGGRVEQRERQNIGSTAKSGR